MMARRTPPARRREHGFTLIELLVVVIIIGILAAIAIPIFLNQKAKANDAAVVSQASTVAKSIETAMTDATGAVTGTSPDGAVTVNTAAEPVVTTSGVQWSVDGDAASGYCIALWTTETSKYTDAAPLYYDSAKGGLLPAGSTCTNGAPETWTGGTVAAGSFKFKKLSAAEYVTCGVTTKGKAYCWGNGANNSLGNAGAVPNSAVPYAVDTTGVLAGKTITDIATDGLDSTCVIASGKAYCWGDYVFGWDLNPTPSPVALDTSGVLAGKTLTSVTAASGFFCALDSAGLAYCWGYNGNGELGNPAAGGSSAAPVAVDTTGALAGKMLKRLVAGRSTTCALDTAGAGYCWGNGGGGGGAPIAITTTGPLAGHVLTDVSVDGLICVLDTTGSRYCWGSNSSGTLGDGTNSGIVATPTLVAPAGDMTGKTFASMYGGTEGVCGIDTTGKAYCWGSNWGGSAGNGTWSFTYVPTAVDVSGVMAGKTITSMVKGGYRQSCALDSAGQAYCWGNAYLGNGVPYNSLVPVLVTQTTAP